MNVQRVWSSLIATHSHDFMSSTECSADSHWDLFVSVEIVVDGRMTAGDLQQTGQGLFTAHIRTLVSIHTLFFNNNNKIDYSVRKTESLHRHYRRFD